MGKIDLSFPPRLMGPAKPRPTLARLPRRFALCRSRARYRAVGAYMIALTWTPMPPPLPTRAKKMG